MARHRSDSPIVYGVQLRIDYGQDHFIGKWMFIGGMFLCVLKLEEQVGLQKRKGRKVVIVQF